jgi:hypothetical protein
MRGEGEGVKDGGEVAKAPKTNGEKVETSET